MRKTGKFLGCFLPVIVALLCQISVSVFFSMGYGVYMEVKEETDGFVWLTAEQVEVQAALPTAFRQFWEETEHV